MGVRVYANNVSTKLTAQLLVGGTTANVTAGDGALFAGANGSDWIIGTLRRMSGSKDVAREIVKITARSTDALTITRAQEGTAALQFEIGDQLDIDFTAASLSDAPISPSQLTGAGPALGGQCTTLASIAATATTYFVPGQVSASATEAARQQVTHALTVTKLIWNAASANDAGGHDGLVVMTLRKNGANTAVTITMADNEAAGVKTDTVNSATFAQGDLLSISITNNNTTAAYAFTNSSVLVVYQ